MSRRAPARWIIGVLALLCAASAGAGEPAEGARLQVEPAVIEQGMFFDGARVSISAWYPAGCEAAVVCAGKEEDLDLAVKGKVGGFLWMNVGEAKFSHLPSLYRLGTTCGLSAMAPAAILRDLGVGYDALESASASSQAGEERQRLFAELIRLKEREELYGTGEGSLRTEPASPGMVRAAWSFPLPACTPPGECAIRLYVFQNGRGRLLQETPLRLVRVGLTVVIAGLARDHGLFYGIFAVLIALGCGLLTGIVFSRGAQKHH